MEYRFCVQEVYYKPVHSSSFNDAVKKQLVINLRYLNQFFKKESFKYENLLTAQDSRLPVQIWSYHHVWITGIPVGANTTYVFTVLPFGLQKLVYLDDWIVAANGMEGKCNGQAGLCYDEVHSPQGEVTVDPIPEDDALAGFLFKRVISVPLQKYNSYKSHSVQ